MSDSLYLTLCLYFSSLNEREEALGATEIPGEARRFASRRGTAVGVKLSTMDSVEGDIDSHVEYLRDGFSNTDISLFSAASEVILWVYVEAPYRGGRGVNFRSEHLGWMREIGASLYLDIWPPALEES